MTSPAVDASDIEATPANPDLPAKPRPRLGSLRALWPFVRKHSGLFVAWLIALALASAATLSLPMAVKQIIDHGFTSGSNIDRAFLSLFGVAVLLALASAARFYFVSLLGERVVADLRQKLYGAPHQPGRRFPRPHPQRRTGLAPLGRQRTVAQRGRHQHVGRLAQQRHRDRRPGHAVRHQSASGYVRVDRHPCCRVADRARQPPSAARSRAPARTASPTPTAWPAKPWAPCARCRRMRASPTSAAVSAAPWRSPWKPHASAYARRPG